jgi:hypothetical protein
MTTSKARLQANLLNADGTLKATTIADNTITSDKIATGTIATVDMADSSVTSLQIANGSINTIDIADGAVTFDKISGPVREFGVASYTADSAQTTFAADSNPGYDNGLLVFVNGTFQTSGVNYTRADANVVFDTGLDADDQVDIIRTSFVTDALVPEDGSITPAKFSNQLQNIVTDRFTGDGTTLLFTLTEQPYNANGVLVFVDGVNQIPDVNYSIDSSAITFGSAPDSDADIFVSHITYRLGEYAITPSAGTVTEASFSSEINFLNDGYLVVKSNTGNPSNPNVGQLYYDDSEGAGFVWNGSEWIQFTNNFAATGGIENTYADGGFTYKSHTFLTSGLFNISGGSTEADILLVAGGAGGGGANGGSGGGGGAGGMVVTTQTLDAGTYTMTVGAGGAGGASGTNRGVNGSNTSMTLVSTTAIGGGGGGGSEDADTAQTGADGGSGGGGGGDDAGGNPVGSVGGSGTAGQGNAGGGGGGHTSGDLGGGGGGAGAAGEDNEPGVKAGDGGVGLQNNYRTGSNVYYAGGGGGGTNQGDGVGGLGGGGTGMGSGNESAGTANTGGGGGGARAADGLAGGSGIIVVRYKV